MQKLGPLWERANVQTGGALRNFAAPTFFPILCLLYCPVKKSMCPALDLHKTQKVTYEI